MPRSRFGRAHNALIFRWRFNPRELDRKAQLPNSNGVSGLNVTGLNEGMAKTREIVSRTSNNTKSILGSPDLVRATQFLVSHNLVEPSLRP